MASFDENGKYIKTNWKAGDKITATKLNKIEESIEAVNDNDISRHVEADARLDALEAKDVTHDKELTNIKKTIADNKAAAELGDYDINSRMQFLEQEFNEGIEEVHNVASTVDGKITQAESDMTTQVNTAKNEMTTQVNTAKNEMTTQVNTAKNEMTTQVNTAQANMTAQVNQGKADMEAMVAEVEGDLSSSISEELTNNNVASFKAGTSNVTGVDLTHQMEQSIVSLDNIEGKTEVMDNITDPAQKLKNTHIKLLYTLDKDDQFNYFNTDNLEMGVLDSRVNYQHSTSPSETIRIHSDVALRGSCLLVEVTGLTPGEVYCLTVGSIRIENGVSAIAIYDSMKHNLLSNTMVYHSEDPTQSDTGLVAKVSSDRLGFIFYSNTGLDVAGDVTYQDISLRKVKEYSPMNITLRSLPNGIKDEIKDGKLIKRVESYTLNGSENWAIADNSKTKTISFACLLPNAAPVSKDVISLNSNKYKSSSDAELYTEDVIGLAIGGLNSNHLLFRVDRGLNTAEKLKYHLANGEKDVIVEYAIQPEVYDIDLSIVCDSDDIVYINTNRNISCSHQVQLSTKSQVEEAQKQIAKSNKSIWQKFKELTEKLKTLTDVEVKIGQNGYIKLPTILGGLLIQWGRTSLTFNNEQYKATIVEYPIPFKTDIYFQTCNIFNDCTEAYETNTSIVWNSLLEGKICIYNTRGNMSSDVFVYYIAIGK